MISQLKFKKCYIVSKRGNKNKKYGKDPRTNVL